jgi:hypothetical protein
MGVVPVAPRRRHAARIWRPRPPRVGWWPEAPACSGARTHSPPSAGGACNLSLSTVTSSLPRGDQRARVGAPAESQHQPAHQAPAQGCRLQLRNTGTPDVCVRVLLSICSPFIPFGLATCPEPHRLVWWSGRGACCWLKADERNMRACRVQRGGLERWQVTIDPRCVTIGGGFAPPPRLSP